MCTMAYVGSQRVYARVWRRQDVCRTFARSQKAALGSQPEPFSPIEMRLDAGRGWGRPERAGFGSGSAIAR